MARRSRRRAVRELPQTLRRMGLCGQLGAVARGVMSGISDPLLVKKVAASALAMPRRKAKTESMTTVWA